MTTVKPKNDAPLINEKIRHEEMQLITHEGKNLGVVSREDALRFARTVGLDLAIIAEQGADGVPVAKIMDFGKVLYAKKKQQAEAKKRQQVIQIKELKLRPKIAEHDYQTKMNQAIQFLKEGKRVKVTLMFKGREAAMKDERGSELFNKIQQTFDDQALSKNLVQEKDAKSPQLWSRVYYLKK
ncbi:MAG: translation initiation factor IF-3 [Candidatus Babeliaceae bacterium]|jgi:translation initiation factor IF-3